MSFDLSSIGQMLKAGREEHHLGLQEISNVLFIRKRIIEAIENGDWNSLPHMVYVKGYVGQYASYLGIQSKIDEELNHSNVAVEQEPQQAAEVLEMKPRWWGVRKRQIGYAMVAALVLGFLVFQNVQRVSYRATPSFQPESSVLRTVSGVPYEVQGNKLILESKKLMIACQQRTWVRIVIDGTEKKEFIMNPEEVVVLNGKEGFDLLIGNAGGVKLFYNGKDIGFSGDEGEVSRINLS